MNSRLTATLLTATLLTALLLAGCAVGPDYTPPSDGGIPEAFVSRRDMTSGKEDFYILVSCGRGAEPDEIGFFALGDKRLATLQAIAATNNLSIMQAVLRIEASRAALAGSRAEFWPSVGFSAGTSKAKNYNPDGSSERSSLGFDASWEIDLFGKVRRSVEAAKAEFEATEYSLDDAMLSLRAEIAAEYVNLCLQRQLLALARCNLEAQQELADIAKSKFDAGLTTELDWLSAKAQLHSAEATIPATEANATGCIRRIEMLCGLEPGALGEMEAEATIPDIPAASEPPVIDSALLRQRPDVLRAERAYTAALARIGVAKANYYPSVSIGAGLSLSTDSFASWSDAMRSISFGPSLNWSILSFGRTKARVAQARANAEEAALAYREVVLKAFHEVEDAAIALARDNAREAPIVAAYEAQKGADALALKLYREDLGEYRDVLTARQSLIAQERTLAELRANLILSRIAIDKALAL